MDPPFIAALDRSFVALAHVQQVLFLRTDHLSEFNNLESLFFTLALHLVKHPARFGYVIPQAVPDCVTVYMLQTRLLQQPMIDTAVLTTLTYNGESIDNVQLKWTVKLLSKQLAHAHFPTSTLGQW